jgi:hypothetical protein
MKKRGLKMNKTELDFLDKQLKLVIENVVCLGPEQGKQNQVEYGIRLLKGVLDELGKSDETLSLKVTPKFIPELSDSEKETLINHEIEVAFSPTQLATIYALVTWAYQRGSSTEGVFYDEMGSIKAIIEHVMKREDFGLIENNLVDPRNGYYLK